MTMIKFIKSLFWPTIYEPVRTTVPSYEEFKEKAREIANLPPGECIELGPEWNGLSQMLKSLVENYRIENKTLFLYHKDGYAFAHKKYWGT